MTSVRVFIEQTSYYQKLLCLRQTRTNADSFPFARFFSQVGKQVEQFLKMCAIVSDMARHPTGPFDTARGLWGLDRLYHKIVIGKQSFVGRYAQVFTTLRVMFAWVTTGAFLKSAHRRANIVKQ